MAIAKLFNLARMSTATTGTGTITLGSAVSGYLSFANAGVQDGQTVAYGILDGSNSEVGYGVYTSSGTTLTRNVTKSTNSDAAINLSGSAEVFITARAEDIIQATESRIHLLLNSMAIGRASALAQFCGAAFADSFGATTYVDTAGATNLDTGTAGLLKPTVTAGTDQTATHTAATTGGNTVSASSFQQTGTEGWRAFADDGSTTYWQTPSGTTTGWLQYQFGSAKTIDSYTIMSYPSLGARAPKTWTLLGSNTGAFGGEETTLDTQTNITSWTGGDTKTFTVASPASFTYYRLNITANNGDANFLLIAEAQMKNADSANNLTVSSTSIATPAVPTTVIPVIRIKHVDSATAGTDYNITVSRDGGTTYSSNATLTDWFTDPIDSSHVVYGAPVDVSGQPSGSNLRIKVTTANNKNVEIRDWGAIAY